MAPRPRPLQRIATATAQCNTEAAVYGACIIADYHAVYKDKCAEAFLKLKDCYLAALKKGK